MVKKTTAIPVNIISRPKPVAPKPSTPPQLEPQRPAMSEAKKRRMMWWIVGVGSAGAVAIWIWLWPIQMGRLARDTTFDRLANIFHLPTKEQTKGEQEIRTLDKEVFPQFQ